MHPEAALKHDIRNLGLHAYWLLQILKAEVKNNREMAAWVYDVVVGEPTLSSLQELVSGLADQDLEDPLWWAVHLQGQRSQGLGAVLSLDASLQRMDELSSLTVNVNGIDRDLDLREIWQYRHKDTVRAGIRWRLREIKLLLHNINPVYYNALHSLGVIYEAYIQEGYDDFLSLEKQLIKDRETSRTNHRVISGELDKLQLNE